eukprot:gnl/TRDRNA2_/TRDRNA2_176760_c5_seq10.p1 gnl/TRDRNA2_/TRDRNA2_176760_c5~~gnl/TRDRNA2_/TRDRNA2_176760_c5_seq10.p1  ORF type:complete len:468 (+),score=57.89 gnl/TRDRNA2_/TRDRNA2_176760_c5_seq10:77-1480(+)
MRSSDVEENLPLKTEHSKGANVLLLVRLLTSVTSIAEGYAVGCLGSALPMVEKHFHLTNAEVGLLTGITYFAMAIGTPAAGWGADRFGRLPGLAFTYCLLVSGALMMGVSTSFYMLLLGRIIESVGIGAGLSIVTTYLSEVAPAAHRGKFSSLEEGFIVFGMVLGAVVSKALLHVPHSWRWIFGAGAVLPGAMLCLFPMLPESPRWLLTQDRQEEAESILRLVADDAETAELLAGWEKQARKDTGTWLEVVCQENVTQARAVRAGMGVMVLQMLCGINIVIFHQVQIFTEFLGKDSAFGWALLISALRFAIGIAMCFIVDSVGRRPLLLISSIACTCSMSFLAFSSLALPAGWKIVGVAMFALSFDLGLGPVAFVYTGEVMSTRLRSKGVSLAIGLSRFTAGIMLLVWPNMSARFGEGQCFLGLGVLNLISCIFVILCVPESAGFSLEAISEQHLQNTTSKAKALYR